MGVLDSISQLLDLVHACGNLIWVLDLNLLLLNSVSQLLDLVHAWRNLGFAFVFGFVFVFGFLTWVRMNLALKNRCVYFFSKIQIRLLY
jgi:hypothetical protein